jgi:Peptidase family M23
VRVMTTSLTHSVAAAIGALTLASAAVSFTGTASQAEAATHVQAAAPAARFAYGWPVKPFNRQHPVRGYFGDPRIASHGQARQFHFGIDISALNGTPVYATVSGTISIHALHSTTVLIAGPNGAEFSYWHVIPTVRSGQHAVAYRTVIGHIEAPYGHVHFSESQNRRYLNPLRPGALGPYADETRPQVTSVRAEVGGRRLQSATAREDFDLVAVVRDETPLAVPRPWHDLPVMPALVRWRLLDARARVVHDWRTTADFRRTIPPASAFDSVWAPGATQNHVRAPGRYRLYLARGRETQQLGSGSYTVEVAVADTRRNGARLAFPLVISSVT